MNSIRKKKLHIYYYTLLLSINNNCKIILGAYSQFSKLKAIVGQWN